MRLLHVIRSANPRDGGPIEVIKTLSRVHVERGRKIEVVCLDNVRSPWVADFPVPLHCLGPSIGKYGYTPQLIKWLRKTVPQFDAVIVNGVWQYSSFGTHLALRKTSIPYFLFPHGMLDPWFERTYPLKHQKKLLYWKYAERHVFKAARAVLFTAEEEKRQAQKAFPDYSCQEEVITYAAAEPPAYRDSLKARFLNQFPSLAGKRFLLFLARLHRKKGLDILLKGYALFLQKYQSDLHLVISGPASTSRYLRYLQDLTKTLKIEAKVHWTGMLDSTLKWGALQASEAFILSSHQENFGVAVAEAMACGVPVLISNKVNIWREIQEDQAGLVADDTVEGVGDLLFQWEQIPDKSVFGRAARLSYNNRYRPAQAADRLINLFTRYGIRDTPADPTP